MICTVSRLWKLDRAIQRQIGRVESVLDLGAGIQPQRVLRAPTIRVDLWRRYRPDVLADLRTPLPFLDRAVDVVWCSDAIEHLEREEGIRLLAEMDRVARRGVVVRTPLGFCEHAAVDSPWEIDREQANPHQAHRSGWAPEDLLVPRGAAWVIPRQPEHPNEWYHAGWFAAWRPTS